MPVSGRSIGSTGLAPLFGGAPRTPGHQGIGENPPPFPKLQTLSSLPVIVFSVVMYFDPGFDALTPAALYISKPQAVVPLGEYAFPEALLPISCAVAPKPI